MRYTHSKLVLQYCFSSERLGGGTYVDHSWDLGERLDFLQSGSLSVLRLQAVIRGIVDWDSIRSSDWHGGSDEG